MYYAEQPYHIGDPPERFPEKMVSGKCSGLSRACGRITPPSTQTVVKMLSRNSHLINWKYDTTDEPKLPAK